MQRCAGVAQHRDTVARQRRCHSIHAGEIIVVAQHGEHAKLCVQRVECGVYVRGGAIARVAGKVHQIPREHNHIGLQCVELRDHLGTVHPAHKTTQMQIRKLRNAQAVQRGGQARQLNTLLVHNQAARPQCGGIALAVAAASVPSAKPAHNRPVDPPPKM